MRFCTSILATLATAKLASAHATVFAALINGVDQGLGNSPSGYIRSPPNNSPVKEVTSQDMTCNINGKTPVAKTLSVKAGDKFTFEWHHNNRDPGDDIIADSHKGPVLVYIAPTAAGTAGNGWVKIYEDGYDPATKLWAVDKLITNKGLHSVTIPNVAAGEYLLRAEIIALHEGFMRGGAQFYMECVQIKVTSNGNALPQGVSIPGTYSADDPGIYFNLYSGNVQSYPIPGPPIWSGARGTPSSVSPSATTTSRPAPATTSQSPPTTTSTTLTTTSRTSLAPSTLSTSTLRTTTMTISSTTSSPSLDSCQGGDVAQWQQCGGINYSGPTRCKNGLICKEWNPYYFQCIMP